MGSIGMVEEPDERIVHVRICGGDGEVTPRLYDCSSRTRPKNEGGFGWDGLGVARELACWTKFFGVASPLSVFNRGGSNAGTLIWWPISSQKMCLSHRHTWTKPGRKCCRAMITITITRKMDSCSTTAVRLPAPFCFTGAFLRGWTDVLEGGLPPGQIPSALDSACANQDVSLAECRCSSLRRRRAAAQSDCSERNCAWISVSSKTSRWALLPPMRTI